MKMKYGSVLLQHSMLILWRRVVKPGTIRQSTFALFVCGAAWLGSLPVPVAGNGAVVAWGTNDYGQCTIPASLGGFGDINALAGGRYHSIALKNDGTVVTWGGGWGADTNEFPEGLNNVEAIATGFDHNLVLETSGIVTAWGSDNYLQCTLVDGMSDVKAIAAARNHSVVLQNDGTIVGKGYYVSYTTNVAGGVALASGYSHDLVLKSDGKVVASRGETVDAGVSNVMAIAAGASHSLALQSNGVVMAWGGDTTLPEGLTNIVAIAAKGSHSLALRSDGTVVAWGTDYYGQTMVPAGLSNVTVIGTGIGHSLAVGEFAAEISPILKIAGTVSSVTLSWEPDTPGWALQKSDNLVSNAWTDATSGSTNPAVIPATQPAVYFRLHKP